MRANIWQYLQLLFISSLASSTFLAIKIADTAFSPFEVTLGRAAIAAAVLWPFALIAPGRWPRMAHSWLLLAVIAMCGGLVPFTLLNWAETHLESAMAALLWSTLPLFGLVLAHLFTRDDRFSPYKLFSVIVGLAAVSLVLYPGLSQGHAADIYAQAAVLAAALLYAVAGVAQNRLRESIDPIRIAAVAMTVSALLTAAAFPFVRATSQPVDGWAVFALLYLAIFPTALLHYLRFRLIAQVGYTFVSYTGYLVPVFGLFLGAVVLGERLPKSAYFAGGMVLAAVAISRVRAAPATRVAQPLDAIGNQPDERRTVPSR
ncbi:DMT family transporter [Bradyrhizobium sp. HKCCYLS1011]|uniref:DMT family transporter n=1 Tax=Bradyrhizobium sp. HKCCYLS1011 TaxID=3420733 RepID=UPI003EBE5ED7